MTETQAEARLGTATHSSESVTISVQLIWRSFFGDKASEHASFGALGGDSITAFAMRAAVQEKLRLDTPVSTYFRASSLPDLTEKIATLLDQPQPDRGMESQRTSNQAPLSVEQELQLLMMERMQGLPAYVRAYRIEGPLHGPALSCCLDEIMARQNSLRSTFPKVRGKRYRKVLPNHGKPLTIINAEGLPSQAHWQYDLLWNLHQDIVQWRPDTASSQLARFLLVRHEQQRHTFIAVLHPLIADENSFGILFRSLNDLYPQLREGRAALLPELTSTYEHYAREQRHCFNPAAEQEKAYWQERLGKDSTPISLPGDRARPARWRFHGKMICDTLSSRACQNLQAFCRQHELTPFMVLAAAYQVLLHRISNRTGFCVCVRSDGRVTPKYQDTIGPFAKGLPLCTQFKRNDLLIDLLKQIKLTALDAFDRQGNYCEQMLNDREPDPSLPPRSQIMFSYRNHPSEGLHFEGTRTTPLAFEQVSTCFDLRLDIVRNGDTYDIALIYNADLLDHSVAERMLNHYRVLTDSMLTQTGTPLSAMPMLLQDERRLWLETWNQTATDIQESDTVHGRIQVTASQQPDAVAVQDERAILTYAGLERAANQLAKRLVSVDIEPESFVGIFATRSCAMTVSLLAVLKAGCAYVPLDPDYPDDRLAFMTRDCQAPVILVQRHLANRLPPHQATVFIIEDDADLSSATFPRVSSDQAMYAIYTSGSTGRPKGVINHHRGLINRLDWMQSAYKLNTQDVVLQKTPFSFDVSVWEFFWTLMQGAKLVMAKPSAHGDPSYLQQVLQNDYVTTLHFVPSMLRAFVDTATPTACATVSRVFSSGEALSHDLKERFFEVFDGSLENLYGPTEAAIDVTSWSCRPDPGEALVPIGKPIANTSIYITDPNLEPVPPGVPGELLIGGMNLARGYHQRPSLTARCFIPNPFANKPGERLYRSGDLARFRTIGRDTEGPDGAIVYLGRLDNQVKLRGFRIELGEIEANLNHVPGITEAVVKDERYEDGRLYLCAYLRVDSPNPSLTTVRQQLHCHLPDYMVPSAFVVMDRFPQLPNGKINRKKLHEMARTHGRPLNNADCIFVGPRNPIEAKLCDHWSNLLNQAHVGIDHNFFTLGGDSLLATQMIHQLCHEFEVYLPLSATFQAPTIRGLAALIAGYDPSRGLLRDMPALTIDKDSLHEPFPLNHIQQAYFLGRTGAFQLGNVACHMFLEFKTGQLDIERLNTAWQRLIERHDMLRTVIEPGGRQRILASVPPYQIEIEDRADLDPDTAFQALENTRERYNHEVFDPTNWPLFRVCGLRLPDGDLRLFVSLDLLIVDGFSFVILFDEWSRFYREPDWSPAPLDLSFRDYILAENQFKSSATYQRAQNFWQKRLATLPRGPELPLAKPPSAIEKPRFQRREASLSEAQWSRLKARAQDEGLTPSVILCTAYADVLATWSKADHFVLNLTLFNRTPVHPDVERILGDFTTLNLLEVDRGVAKDFRERARAVQERLWEDLEYREYSGVQVMRDMAAANDLGNAARMPVVFTSMLKDYAKWDWLGEVSYSITQTPQVWLDHVATEHQGTLRFHWDFVSGLFPDGMIDAMFDTYVAWLGRIAEEPSSWTEETPPLLPPVQVQTRMRINDTRGPVPECLLHQGFEYQADADPNASAVITWDDHLTFGELERLTNRIAHTLRAAGASRNQLIAVVMEKGWQQAVAVIAINKSGAAYVPVDANQPKERVRQLIDSSLAELVLTQESVIHQHDWQENLTIIPIDKETAPDQPETRPEPVNEPSDLAYVIFTSGSTGQPKGVVIDHAGPANTCADINRRFNILANDRVFGISALNFDLSVYDVFGTLAAGAALVLPTPNALRDPSQWSMLIRREQVTVWNSVPALMQMLTDYHHGLGELLPPSLRLIMMSGDWIPVSLPDQIRTQLPSATLISMGGATEASIWSILYPINQVGEEWKSIPYGKPMVNQRFHVLNRRLEPCPVWVPGHLYIGGMGLAKGYWRDPEKSATSFFEHPRTGERLYATGDLGRYLPDGNIEFLGREDHQVKIRGHRIELGEIEANLNQHPGVAESLITVQGNTIKDRQLVAYVIPRESVTSGFDGHTTAITGGNPSGATLTDPVERLSFKMAEKGIRDDLPAPASIALQSPGPKDRDNFLRRRSFRHFKREAITLESLGNWLGCLRRETIDGFPLPKYQYASAGGLYPIQVYLHLKDDAVVDTPCGFYYYHPKDHMLVPVAEGIVIEPEVHEPQNRQAFNDAGLSLFFVANLDAIEPMYGHSALPFCWMETGIMCHLLEARAPEQDIGMCHVGNFAFDRFRDQLPFNARHHYLHSMLAGVIDPQWLTRGPSEDDMTGGKAGTNQDLSQSLRTHLAKQLPDYMVPNAWVLLERFPLTANGKVDRKALPAPNQVLKVAKASHVAPENDVEQRLTEVMEDLFGIEKISVEANLSQLGGHSIQMVRAHAKLQQVLGRTINIVDLFRASTIRGLAEILGDGVEKKTVTRAQLAKQRGAERRGRLERRRGNDRRKS